MDATGSVKRMALRRRGTDTPISRAISSKVKSGGRCGYCWCWF